MARPTTTANSTCSGVRTRTSPSELSESELSGCDADSRFVSIDLSLLENALIFRVSRDYVDGYQLLKQDRGRLEVTSSVAQCRRVRERIAPEYTLAPIRTARLSPNTHQELVTEPNAAAMTTAIIA
jgi:hypothetical protein